jgi:hypothetical protein
VKELVMVDRIDILWEVQDVKINRRRLSLSAVEFVPPAFTGRPKTHMGK